MKPIPDIIGRGARVAKASCVLLLLLAIAAPGPLYAQSPASGNKPVTLWVDQRTGQVFVRPGRGRVPLELPGATINPEALEQRVEQKVEQKTQARFEQSQARIEASNAQLKQEVDEIRPAWRDYIENFKDKMRVGALFYADYAMFTHTGYGPQFLSQQLWPGPENNMYNSFDLTRTYLNFFFFPTPDWTLRITPNLYRMTGNGNSVTEGRSTSVGSNLNGNLGLRVKYAYVQWNTPFKGNDMFGKDHIIFGVLPQPLTSWEEDLYGFRWVNLTTWNMAVSSTFPGLAIAGPVLLGPEGLQYIDYQIGVYDSGSFHQYAESNTKHAWGRISIYPFGAKWRFDGLGITSVYDYGYGLDTPDENYLSAFQTNGANGVIQRLAEIVHYTTTTWQLAGEFDWGRNAFSSGALFSGSAPAPTPGLTPWINLAHAVLDNGSAKQLGFNFFGHYHFQGTPFTLFGWFEQWMPNTNVHEDPFDFQRFIVGIAYQYNEYLSLALDSQNILYYHSQFNYPAGYSIPPSGKLGPAVQDAVPRDIHAFMANVQFAF